MKSDLILIATFASIAAGQAIAAPVPLPATVTPAAAAPMTADQLADVSGGQAVIVNAANTQSLTAAVSGNQVVAGTIQSGSVSFDKGTFAGFNGIGNFVINTGNNNVLQGSLSVTVVPLH